MASNASAAFSRMTASLYAAVDDGDADIIQMEGMLR